MILSPDNENIYLISTYDGILYILNNNSYSIIDKIQLGNNKDHINTIAIKRNLLYTIFHNLGLSDVVVFDMNNNYHIVNKYENIG